MRFGIQLKVAALLVALLTIAYGASTLVASASLSRALASYGESSTAALRQATFAQARPIFSTLEVGSRNSIEQGEMEAFRELLVELGKVHGVREIGLAAPEGNILYSNRPVAEWKSLPQKAFTAAMRPKAETEELAEGDTLLLLKAHRFERGCLRCHSEPKEGDLAGVLFARYDLSSLRAAEAEGEARLATARSTSERYGLVGALVALLIASLGTYLFLGALVRRPLTRLIDRLSQIARGEADLSARLPVQSGDEMGEVARQFNALMENLQALVQQLRQTSIDVARGSGDMREASRNLLRSANEQASSSRAAAAATEFMGAAIGEVARGAKHAAEISGTAAKSAEVGCAVIGESLQGLTRIEERVRALHASVATLSERSQAISSVMDLIDDLAEQTRILAINASIEAARAGDAAAGFSVVAAEVRKLSERTAEASEQAREALAAILRGTEGVTGSVAEGLHEVEKSGEAARMGEKALKEIVAQIETSATSVSAIAASTDQQSAAVQEISRSLASVVALSESLASYVQQSDRSAETFSERTQQLAALAARFKA